MHHVIYGIKYEFIFSGPGIAGCNYLGYINKQCGFPELDASCLPEACTSIIYDGVFVDLTYNVFGNKSDWESNKKILGNITNITKLTYICTFIIHIICKVQ